MCADRGGRCSLFAQAACVTAPLLRAWDAVAARSGSGYDAVVGLAQGRRSPGGATAIDVGASA